MRNRAFANLHALRPTNKSMNENVSEIIKHVTTSVEIFNEPGTTPIRGELPIAWAHCLALLGIAWRCLAVVGIGWHWLVMLGIAWHCSARKPRTKLGIAWHCSAMSPRKPKEPGEPLKVTKTKEQGNPGGHPSKRDGSPPVLPKNKYEPLDKA